MNRYFLIVSQYRHTYYSFVCKVPNNIAVYKSKLLAVVEELEKYKRGPDDTREIHYGDLDFLLEENKEIFYRYNINDIGDIYILNHESINRLKEEAFHYELQSYKDSRRYISEAVLTDISNHHSKEKIREIIQSNFEIA